ncbi:MAG: cytochrome c, partial [Rhodothermales bacterium]
GLTGEVTVGNEVYSGAMPPWGSFLDDKQMSELLTYIRANWGNQASAVTVEEISKVRAAVKERREPWTADELLKEENSGVPGEAETK